MRPGEVERRTHDYTRNGTLSLFAALDTATGKVIEPCCPSLRGREFLSFLREIELNVSDDLDVHLVMDNYATHKTPAFRKWLGAQSRWHVHFAPTSRINLVERLFADVSDKQFRRGVHRYTAELPAAIHAYLEPSMRTQNPSGGQNPPTTFWLRQALLSEKPRNCFNPCRNRKKIGIGGSLAAPPLPHHRAYGSVHGGSDS